MDEMDLMKDLREVPSPRPEAYDRARTALHTAMAEPVNTVVRPKRWMSWTKAGVAAVSAAAVAAAVVMGTTDGNVPAGPSDAAQQVVVESPLVKLASAVQAAGTLPGEASLIINTKLLPDGPQLYYTVYTDQGQVFTGDSPQNLAATVAKGAAEPASPFNAKVTAAARLAANGDVEKAKVDMITAAGNPLGIGLSPAEADEAWARAMAEVEEKFRESGQEVPDRPTGEELENRIDNHLFSNTTHALYIAASDAEVRAGVLKLLATMEDVTIGKTDVDGQAALTLTAAPAIQGGNTTYVLTVNADNGLPIRSEGIPVKDAAEPSKPWVVNYKTGRVTLADVAAGKF
ncbi:hypothetical protein BN6_52260 [Saccharothrix espanaensis DSM 44229]|uniref:CU044_5270 family protein n=2 Tax=Saccharothrix espanaensis TaxID=103731 RepID=K0K2D9_SACES|nr:hypothetical protein BN6_52260 [Saccharothrix espanaensis DSM 44229]